MKFTFGSYYNHHNSNYSIKKSLNHCQTAENSLDLASAGLLTVSFCFKLIDQVLEKDKQEDNLLEAGGKAQFKHIHHGKWDREMSAVNYLCT